jgi:hypothetical protein
MTPIIALLIGILTALIPLSMSLWLIRARQVDRAKELARLAVVTTVSVLLLLAGPWVWSTYWMRPATAVVVALAIVCSVRRLMRGRPTATVIRWDMWLMVVGALGVLLLDLSALRSGSTEDIISLELPLQGRTFAVLQGGNSPVTNPFHGGDSAGRLSLDIVALGGLGIRARRLLSTRLPENR